MRILHSLEGRTWSGGQQQALLLALGQVGFGHEVLLACQAGGALEARAAAAGIKVLPIDYGREIHLRSMLALSRAYDEFRPDVVNVHRAWAHTQWVLLALLKRFKGLIVTRRVLFRPDFNPVSRIKYCTAAVRGYIAVSKAVASRLLEIGVSKKRIEVVHSATDMNRFDPCSVPPMEGVWPVPADAPAVILIGNYNRNKGHRLVVEAFDKCFESRPELNLVIAGRDTDSRELHEIVRRCKAANRIHLLGFRTDIPALLSRCVASINASFEEGFPGSVRESLAMGVPVIASDIPGNREIHNICPIDLFAPGSSDSLAKALLAMKIQPHPFSQTLRNSAVEYFSVPSMVAKTCEAYKRFVKEK